MATVVRVHCLLMEGRTKRNEVTKMKEVMKHAVSTISTHIHIHTHLHLSRGRRLGDTSLTYVVISSCSSRPLVSSSTEHPAGSEADVSDRRKSGQLPGSSEELH